MFPVIPTVIPNLLLPLESSEWMWALLSPPSFGSSRLALKKGPVKFSHTKILMINEAKCVQISGSWVLKPSQWRLERLWLKNWHHPQRAITLSHDINSLHLRSPSSTGFSLIRDLHSFLKTSAQPTSRNVPCALFYPPHPRLWAAQLW